MARLSLIQVGAGHWGRSWAELCARSPGFRLAALVDGSRAARDWAASSLDVPVFPGLEGALASIAADAVLVVSPAATHRELADQSLPAARHVVVQQPFALGLGDP